MFRAVLIWVFSAPGRPISSNIEIGYGIMAQRSRRSVSIILPPGGYTPLDSLKKVVPAAFLGGGDDFFKVE